MFDLIITGGAAVMPASTEAADIGVGDGKIVAIGAAGERMGFRRAVPGLRLAGRQT